MSFQEFPQTCRTTGSQQLYNIILAQYFSVFEVSHKFDLALTLKKYSFVTVSSIIPNYTIKN